MKRIIAAAAGIVFLAAFAFADVWKNDKNHSELTFSIVHLGINDVTGKFKSFDATITASKADFSDAVFTLSADVASIDTEVEMRDNHLRSADFFEVEKFPKMTFESTSLEASGKDTYRLNGNLTIHGVTKPVTMELKYRGTIENPMSKKPTAGFALSGTIRRSDFGIGPKFPAPMLSDEVQIKASGEFGK